MLNEIWYNGVLCSVALLLNEINETCIERQLN